MAGAVLADSTPAERLLASDRPLIIAHAGFSGIAPQNTLPAFRLALEAGADMVELDYCHIITNQPTVIRKAAASRASQP